MRRSAVATVTVLGTVAFVGSFALGRAGAGRPEPPGVHALSPPAEKVAVREPGEAAGLPSLRKKPAPLDPLKRPDPQKPPAPEAPDPPRPDPPAPPPPEPPAPPPPEPPDPPDPDPGPDQTL